MVQQKKKGDEIDHLYQIDHIESVIEKFVRSEVDVCDFIKKPCAETYRKHYDFLRHLEILIEKVEKAANSRFNLCYLPELANTTKTGIINGWRKNKEQSVSDFKTNALKEAKVERDAATTDDEKTAARQKIADIEATQGPSVNLYKREALKKAKKAFDDAKKDKKTAEAAKAQLKIDDITTKMFIGNLLKACKEFMKALRADAANAAQDATTKAKVATDKATAANLKIIAVTDAKNKVSKAKGKAKTAAQEEVTQATQDAEAASKAASAAIEVADKAVALHKMYGRLIAAFQIDINNMIRK